MTYPALNNMPLPNIEPHRLDAWEWKDVNGNGGDFLVKMAYCSLDNVYPRVMWAKGSQRFHAQKLFVEAAFYYIWKERNNRNFRKESRNPDDLVKNINDTVHMRQVWKTRGQMVSNHVRA
ncbi:hypothetical protein L6452_25965 [Arctium lappa]|uniref:Uncharacterized protein n=1 Tax=Arctium lappa TaxID=4217 RepID=A0ACB9AC61_ARCLA|nr:hypothetical protein L6452_25965 [Arctium lappa]